MWIEITQAKYEQNGLGCASEMANGEWALIAPVMPLAKALGRPRTTGCARWSTRFWICLAAAARDACYPRDFRRARRCSATSKPR